MKSKKFSSTLVMVFIFVMAFSLNVNAASLPNNIIANIDVNHDAVIDIKDLAKISLSYNSGSTDVNWNSDYDINNDLTVDIYDFTLISKYIGQTMSFKNMSINTYQYDAFNLPKLYMITLSNGKYINTPVIWSTVATTQNIGKYTYTGTLTDYNRSVTLILNVASPKQTGINQANIANLGIIAKQGEWIYYLNQANDGKLSKIKSDGTSVVKLTDDTPFYINVLDGWVYYNNVSDNYCIYKVRTDGTERTKLNSDISEFIHVVDDWIYYQNNSDDFKLYKMKLDGTERTKITDDRCLFMNIVGDWIYYSNYSNYGEICKIKKDGTGKIILNDETSTSIIVDGNWIYYLSEGEGNKLYKIGLDGSNRTEISGTVNSFNVSGDWIYFPNLGEGGRPFKMKTDGSEATRLDFDSTLSLLNVIDDSIYFIDEKDFKLYKMKNDGSTKSEFGLDTVISNIEDVKSTATQGDLYELPTTVLTTMSDGSKLYKPVAWNTSVIDTSIPGSYKSFQGTVTGYSKNVSMTVTVIERAGSNGNSVNQGIVSQMDEWIYFKDNSDGKLYKMKNDDTGKVKLTDDVATSIHVSSGWIYYVADVSWHEPRLFKVKTDGTQRTQLTDNNKIGSFNLLGDWIYYSNNNDNQSLYKIKTDGSNDIKLNDDDSFNINVSNDWIYYTSFMDHNSIYKINIDGSQRTKISTANATKLNVYNGYIYYINGTDGSKIYKVKTDGTANEKVCDDSSLYLNVDNGWIFYCNNSDSDKLYKIKIDGTQKSKITDDNLYCGGLGAINILGNFIYYKNYSDLSKIYRVTLDGKEKQPFGSIITISRIEDIYVAINTNSQYILPKTILAHMSEGLDNEHPVTWNTPIAITSKAGNYTFEGTVEGYGEKVKLTLSVEDTVSYGNTPGNLSNETIAAISGEWIYYYTYSVSTGGKLNKVKTDGTGNVNIITGFTIKGVNVVGDWIYYLKGSILYKIKTDGTGNIQLIDNYVNDINVVDDWIYYADGSSGGLYRVRTDGTQKTKISSVRLQDMIIVNGWIYFKDDYSSLYRMRVDGTGKTSLGYSLYYNIVGDYIYYYSDGNINRAKTDGTEIITIVKASNTNSINVSGDWIYYTDNYQLYKIKLDGSLKTLLSTDNIKQINVVSDWIYYISNLDNYFYRIKTDGTGREKLGN